jgi:hypothetical protein
VLGAAGSAKTEEEPNSAREAVSKTFARVEEALYLEGLKRRGGLIARQALSA